MIKVTRTFLPPLEEYLSYLKPIWESAWVTNHGPSVGRLEDELRRRLDVPHFYFLANGTIALQLAYRALGLSGEVITTPFTYVATTSTLVWEGCKPVLVDIEPDTLTIDPARVEAAITPRTTAIVATHVYGNPCDVLRLADIARRHGLRLVYDAAHAFDVRHRGRPLAAYGDVSTLSFHATKIFHTVEGGGVTTPHADVAHRLGYMRNFGHDGEERFFGLGVNGKNSELHAAMGLCLLPHMPEIVARRRDRSNRYDRLLSGAGARLSRPRLREETEYNYAYYPVLFASEADLLAARRRLQAVGVHPRRYFYPSLADLPYVDRFEVPVSRDVSRRVLCLPLYAELTEPEVDRVVEGVLGSPTGPHAREED